MKNRGEKRHAAVVQRVTWSHRCGNSPAQRRGGKSVVRRRRAGRREWRGVRRATHRVGPHLRVKVGLLRHLRVVRRGLLSVGRARGRLGVRAGVVRLHGSRCGPLRVVRGVRGWEIAGARRGAVRGRGHAGHGGGLGLRHLRRAFRGDGHGGARAGPRARVTRLRRGRRGRVVRKRTFRATGSRGATARDVRGLGGDARAREGPTGKREPRGGGGRVRSRAPTDCKRGTIASRRGGRKRRFAAFANDDVRFRRAGKQDTVAVGVFPSQILESRHRAKFEVGCRKAQSGKIAERSKATAVCAARRTTRAHAPGVSGRRRSRARRRGEFTGERSKGKSSDMPPRGMSAEVRARKRSFRAVPRFEMLSERATRGA